MFTVKWMADAFEYGVDAFQRAVLYTDILRKRGNNFIEQYQKGQPPVLMYDYEIIKDGRSLERPVNHDLARIGSKDDVSFDSKKRPIVIIDPRAGHGPGIGGFKRDSEIGMALEQGHPVYIILFYPEPEIGQTYDDVKDAQTRFIEEVKNRHPHAEDPLVIGNCQAGWAVALVGAERPDITGPMVLNGSPLSYWAGVEGKNPMRYRGGLVGGIWLTSFLSDLGNGRFDGAHLVMNFEDLNPANTYWSKKYHVWANVDTEEKRFLDFERWWNSYFIMTAEEIHFIVKNLFMGNRMEQGELELDNGKKIDLKDIKDPLILFASSGDNITPPQQALNWIAKVYGSVDEIKRHQNVIVYRVHENIGHLGIFVSGKVARKEHKEFIENVDMLDYLPPGLYELVLKEGKKELMIQDYDVEFVERDISDILALDDGFQDESGFETAEKVSDINERIYNTLFSPWVKALSNDYVATAMKMLHPLRVSRYIFSDYNPAVFPVQFAAPLVKDDRQPVSGDNIFWHFQQSFSDSMEILLELYGNNRDATMELAFQTLFENPVLTGVATLFCEEGEKTDICAETESAKKKWEQEVSEQQNWLDRMEEGGYMEGMVRTGVLAAGADRAFASTEFEEIKKMVMAHDRLKKVVPKQFKETVKNQSRILQTDEEKAIEALPKLLTTKKEREEALEFARRVVESDKITTDEESIILEKIESVLKT